MLEFRKDFWFHRLMKIINIVDFVLSYNNFKDIFFLKNIDQRLKLQVTKKMTL